MACNQLDGNSYSRYLFQLPCSILLCGPSQSGKSWYIKKVIRDFKTEYPKVEILGCMLVAKAKHELAPLMKEHLSDNFYLFGDGAHPSKSLMESLPDREEHCTNKTWIIVFEDLLECSGADLDFLSKMTTFYCNHKCLFSIASLQNFFLCSDQRYITSRRNFSYIILNVPLHDDVNIDMINRKCASNYDLRKFALQVHHEASLMKNGYGAIMLDRKLDPTNELLTFSVRTPPFSSGPKLVLYNKNNDDMLSV